MFFDSLLKNQKNIVKLIDQSIKNNRLFHAYIFDGEDKVSIEKAYLYFASKLLCEQEYAPCEVCANCDRVLNNAHTNVIRIQPEKDVIRKEQIAQIIHELSMTSVETGAKIYIIEDAEKLNKAAANALLKLLEEPYPNHYIILTTQNASRIIDTIASRCELIHFIPINKYAIEISLLQAGVDKDFAYVLSNISNSVEEANKYIEEGNVIDIYEFVQSLYRSMNLGKDLLIDYALKGKVLFKEENLHPIFFNIMLLFIKEKIKYLSNLKRNKKNDSSIHFVEYFSNLKKDYEIKDLIRVLDIINKYDERLYARVNMELLYVSLFTEL